MVKGPALLARSQRTFLTMRHEATLALAEAIRRQVDGQPAAPSEAAQPPASFDDAGERPEPAGSAAVREPAATVSRENAPPPVEARQHDAAAGPAAAARLPLPCPRSAFSRSDLAALAAGDLAAVFGAAYAKHRLNPLLKLAGGAIDQIVDVDPAGGEFGLGRVVAKAVPASEHHAATELLQFFLLYAGVHTLARDGRFLPLQGMPEGTQPAAERRYQMDVAALDLQPEPRLVANLTAIEDGRAVARWNDLSVRLMDARRGSVELPGSAGRKPAAYDERRIHELTVGSIAACCGPKFAHYEGRRGPRLPNGDLQLVSRVVGAQGTWGEFEAPASVAAEFDVPPNAWFLTETSSADAPFAILMELGLQPCGFLSFWLGSTFISPDRDYRFRNLDGHGELLRQVDLRGQTVQSRVNLASSVSMSGMIVQKFGIELACEGEAFYRGEAGCGYFDTDALATHTGLDGGRYVAPWLADCAGAAMELDLGSNGGWLFKGAPGSPELRLAGGRLDLLDRLTVVPNGGSFAAGYVFGERLVSAFDWFYANHFYQDPVMPGSLGVQAMLEALKAYALVAEVGHGLRAPRFRQPLHQPTGWKYRGQILPTHERMSVEVHVKRIERIPGGVLLLGDGSLWGNQLRIYEARDLALAIAEGEPS